VPDVPMTGWEQAPSELTLHAPLPRLPCAALHQQVRGREHCTLRAAGLRRVFGSVQLVLLGESWTC